MVFGWYQRTIKSIRSCEILSSVMNSDEKHIWIKSDYNFACSLLWGYRQIWIIFHCCHFQISFHSFCSNYHHSTVMAATIQDLITPLIPVFVMTAQHYLQWSSVPSPFFPLATWTKCPSLNIISPNQVVPWERCSCFFVGVKIHLMRSKRIFENYMR